MQEVTLTPVLFLSHIFKVQQLVLVCFNGRDSDLNRALVNIPEHSGLSSLGLVGLVLRLQPGNLLLVLFSWGRVEVCELTQAALL